MARQSRAPTLLLTRPLPQSQRFAALVRARWPDMDVVISPLMAADYLSPPLPQRDFAALILTSETGAEAARRISAIGHWLPTRAYCVGDRTAQAAQAAGFEVQSAGGDADDLVALIVKDRAPGPLLFLRGQDSTGDIAARLVLAGIETVSAVTYAQIQQPLTFTAVQLLQHPEPVILPLFSPRSACIFAAEYRTLAHPAPLWLAALSPAVAHVASDLAPQQMGIALSPDAAALLDVIAALLTQGIGS